MSDTSRDGVALASRLEQKIDTFSGSQVSLFAFTLFIHLRKEAGFGAYLTPHDAHAGVPSGVPVSVVTSISTVVGMAVRPLSVHVTPTTALQ